MTTRRRSLVAGEARRDRFKHTRVGSGRTTTERQVALKGQPELDNLDNLFAFSPGPNKDASQYEFDASFATDMSNMSAEDIRSRKRSSIGASSFSSVTPTPVKSTRDAFYAPITPIPTGSPIDASFASEASPDFSPAPATKKTLGATRRGQSSRRSSISVASEITMDDIADINLPDTSLDSSTSSPAPSEDASLAATPAYSKGREKHSIMDDFDAAGMGSPMDSPSPAKPVVVKKKAKKQAKKQPSKKRKEVQQQMQTPQQKVKRPRSKQQQQQVEEESEEEEEAGDVSTSMVMVERTPLQQNTNLRRGQYGNRTGGIIEEAHDSGLLAELAAKEKQARGQVRRSGRQKFKPLDWWRNERTIYQRTDFGVGTFLPTVHEHRAVASPTRFDDVFAKKRGPNADKRRYSDFGLVSRRNKVKLRKKDSKKKKKHKKSQAEHFQAEIEQAGLGDPLLLSHEAEEEDGSTVDGVKRVPLVPHCEVIDPYTQDEVVAFVAKSKAMVALEPLMQVNEDGAPIQKDLVLSGGKMFEENCFSSGVLRIPPNGTKQYEMANEPEIFYVTAGARKSLEVQIHKNTFTLSKGDSFTVPAGNLYHLRNKSSKEPIELYFVLVKGEES